MFNTSKNKSSSPVLKPCKSVQETSEEGLFIKAGQIPDRWLSVEVSTVAWQILSIEVSTAAWQILSIENYENQFFRFDFQPMLIYLCRVYFLTTLDIYKAYFKGRYIWEYKESICKRWPVPYSLLKKLLHLCALGFCNQVLLDLHCWWSEEICSQQSSLSWCVSHIMEAMHHWLVTYWDPCKKGGIHILQSSKVLKQ